MTAHRLSHLQHRILAWLTQEAQRTRGTMAASHQDLVGALGVDKGNLSHSLGNLEAKGLVQIIRTPGGQAEAVDLTPAGRGEVVNKPQVVPARPTKRWRHLTGERWHERLAELRRHIADLKREELFERLAETWPPEVRAGYHRELLQLIEQLTQLARRLAEIEGNNHDHQ